MKKIILISGQARSGKDSTADILMKKLNGKCKKISFAKHLKEICMDYFDWDGTKDEKGRTLLQTVGTDYIRDKLGWQNFHCHRVCEDIKIAEDQYDYFLIPDLRRKNECLYTQANFPDQTITIRVNRTDLKSPLTSEQQNHISEIDLVNFRHDYYINSEEGLHNLEKEIDRVFKGTLY